MKKHGALPNRCRVLLEPAAAKKISKAKKPVRRSPESTEVVKASVPKPAAAQRSGSTVAIRTDNSQLRDSPWTKTNRTGPKQMLSPNLANISASKIDLEWLLKVMPPGEAKLFRVLIRLIPAPSAEPGIAAGRQIKMEVLAKLTGFSKR